MSSGLNDEQVRAEMKKMVSFIRQEAEEKSQEIRAKAEEEASIERANLVQQEKIKIATAYERKNKQLTVQKKIAFSNKLNLARLKVLQSRDTMVEQVFQEAKQNLGRITENADAYRALLENLIVQGLFQLMETEVMVICRRKDVALVKAVLASAAKRYQNDMHHPVTLTCNETIFLKEDCAGGVELSVPDGRIRCTNTLDSRLELLQHEMLPDIRSMLFGKNLNRAFYH